MHRRWVAASLLGKIAALAIFSICPPLAVLCFVAPDLWLLYQLLVPSAQGLGPAYVSFATEHREVWLTIDDGPDERDTPRLLDLLDRHGARASFFLIGEKALRLPETVREIERRGHEVAHHTHTHPRFSFWCAGPRRVCDELDRGLAALARGGARPRRFRPPVGIKNFFLAAALAQRGLDCVAWSHRAFDCAGGRAAEVAGRVLTRIRPGAIILMHEGPSVPEPVRYEAIALVLEGLAARGYACVVPPAGALLRPGGRSLKMTPCRFGHGVVWPIHRMALSFEIEFGSDSAAAFQSASRAGLRLPLARLGDEGVERIFGPVVPAGEVEGFRLYTAGDLLIGCAVEPEHGGMEPTAAAFYRRLLKAAAGKSLYRIWNYVPEINREKAGLENYRAFNAGRARAFAEAFGPGYRQKLAAASGVGCDGSALAAVFVAGSAPARQFENPQQVPAYDYPPEHGPSSPSFSRATAVEAGGHRFLFISGTAAIKGHRTIAPEAIEGQIDCTLENLRLIAEASGVSPTGAGRRHFKVYLRQPADLALARVRLEAALFRPEDKVVWLQANLCRAELLIEIEQTFVS